MSCEEVIEISLPNPEPKLVIEGEINSGLPAIVNLSYNMAYFDVIDSATLTNMFITDDSAIVIVSDGSINDTLTVLPITKFPYTAYVGTTLLGEKGKSYTLNVSYKDKFYFANTTIPEKSPVFKTIWFKPTRDNDSLGMIYYSFFDDGSTYNYYLSTSLVIGKQWWYYQPAIGVPVYDDKFFDGDSTIITLTRGYDGNQFNSPNIDSQEDWDSIVYYKRGDNISLRLSTMDQDFYLWWNSLVRNDFTGSNPYSNPSSVLTNIEGDPALGVWGGYANSYANIHITDSNTVENLTPEDLLPLIIPDDFIFQFKDLIISH